VYDTIKTLNCIDGILSTHQTLKEQKKVDATQKALLDEVISQLTGSKAYQQKLNTIEDKLYHGHEGKGTINGTNNNEDASRYE
jgi:hypothetical protein